MWRGGCCQRSDGRKIGRAAAVAARAGRSTTPSPRSRRSSSPARTHGGGAMLACAGAAVSLMRYYIPQLECLSKWEGGGGLVRQGVHCAA